MEDGNLFHEPKDICDIFNNFFVSVAEPESKSKSVSDTSLARLRTTEKFLIQV